MCLTIKKLCEVLEILLQELFHISWHICANLLAYLYSTKYSTIFYQEQKSLSGILRKSRYEVILKLHYISAMGTSVHEICTKYYGRYVTLDFAKYILERSSRTWSFRDGVISPKEDGEECMDCCNLPEHGTSPVIFCKRNFLLHCLCKKVISKAMLEFKSWKLYWCQRELKVIIISQALHVSVQTSGFRSCLTHPMVNVLDNSSRWATCSI